LVFFLIFKFNYLPDFDADAFTLSTTACEKLDAHHAEVKSISFCPLYNTVNLNTSFTQLKGEEDGEKNDDTNNVINSNFYREKTQLYLASTSRDKMVCVWDCLFFNFIIY
jgi:hypothetical protein